MQIDEFITDESVLKEIGQRISHLRLARNLTQAEVAEEAGVTRPTLARIEKGLPTDFVSVVRLLRALNLMDRLDALVAPQSISPVDLANLKGKERRRARGVSSKKRLWKWGDE